MARHHDAQGIASIDHPDRPRGGRPRDRARDVGVGDGGAGADAAKRCPDPPLEGRAARLDADGVDRVEVTPEVGSDPAAHAERVGRRAQLDRPVAGSQRGEHPMAAIVVIERAEPPLPGGDHEGAERAGDLVGQ